MEEVWKEIGTSRRYRYEISTEGNMRSISWHGDVKNLKKHQNAQGYFYYYAMMGGRCLHLAHRLVAMAFIPNPKHKPVVDHIDGNRANNNVNNLRWATQAENCSNPNTQRRPKLLLEKKIDKRSILRNRPHNDFGNESRGKAIYMDVFRREDILSFSNNSTYYFKFDGNRKVFNACSIIALFRKETKSKIKAHRDMVNHIMKVEVDTIVIIKKN